MILSMYEEIETIGEAANGEELLALLKNQLPDVILMDIRMPIMDELFKRLVAEGWFDDVKLLGMYKENYHSLKYCGSFLFYFIFSNIIC